MRKVVLGAAVLALVLVGVITVRVRAQAASEEGPTQGSGVVENDGVDLSARLSARVVRAAREGSAVTRGEVVVELDCAEPKTRLVQAGARLDATRARARGQGLSAEAAARQSRAAQASVGAARAQLAALTTQRDVATRDAERVQSMGEHAPLARRDQATAAAAQLDARARAARASESASAAKANASRAQADAASAHAEAVANEIVAAEAAKHAAQLHVDECRIIAPRAGIVERVYFDEGELVMPGAVVARVVDPKRVRATFYVSNRDFDDVRLGDKVEVRADAYDDAAFEGTVDRIGIEAEFTPRNVQTRSDRDRLVYPVEVVIANDDRRLRAGMPVTVQVRGGS